jgi:hypothetical protein
MSKVKNYPSGENSPNLVTLFPSIAQNYVEFLPVLIFSLLAIFTYFGVRLG